MKKIATLILCLSIFILTLNARADDKWDNKDRGWHKGFYLLASVGGMNVDEDTNVLNNQAFGSDFLLGYGLTFGWNFLDFLAVELQTRYASEKQTNMREHAANVNINIKYSLILNALTKNSGVRFLPYAKIGGGAFGAAVPDTSAGNNRFGVWGPTAAIGAGMEILIKKMLYVGLDYTQDFAFLQEKFNSAGQKILNGGFDPQYSVFGNIGVHF